jgi:formylmethanofuran dehydrogenase subunit E
MMMSNSNPPIAAATPGPVAESKRCAECGEIFPAQDLVDFSADSVGKGTDG